MICVFSVLLACLAGYGLYRMWAAETRDKTFNSKLPFGRCAARLGSCSMTGMQIICGRKTNRRSLGYWHCSDHPPENAEDVKALDSRDNVEPRH